MKYLVLLVVAIVLPRLSVGQSSSDEKEVEIAVEVLRVALLEANKANLEALTSSNLTYGHSSGTLEDKGAFVDALVSGKSVFTSLEIAKQTIKIIGLIALVRHEMRGEVNSGKINLGVLQVWQKENGKWVLLARQAFKL